MVTIAKLIKDIEEHYEFQQVNLPSGKEANLGYVLEAYKYYIQKDLLLELIGCDTDVDIQIRIENKLKELDN